MSVRWVLPHLPIQVLQHNVLWLQVSVDDLILMQILDTGAYHRGDRERKRCRQTSACTRPRDVRRFGQKLLLYD